MRRRDHVAPYAPHVGQALYSAVVTTVPLLLLALVAADSPIFGPASDTRRGRWTDGFFDAIVLLRLAGGFARAVLGLALVDPPDLRWPAGGGLALGTVGAFVHSAGSVGLRYRRPRAPEPADDGRRHLLTARGRQERQWAARSAEAD